MKNKTMIIRIIVTVLVTLIMYYFLLPPLNLQSFSFWWFLFLIFFVYKVTAIFETFKLRNWTNIYTKPNDFKSILPFGIVLGVFVIIMLVNVVVSPLFNAKSYSERITIDESTDFTADVSEVDFNSIPLLDKDSSEKLGDRVMGQMPELVSQFYVSNLYTQINYNDQILRVTPLEYASIIKYFTNRSEGVMGYITVNSVTGEANLTKLDEGMKYMPSALFNENLMRKLRFSYPTEIFDSYNFEIDDDGNPYWIVPTVGYTGVGVKKEITGVIILDPMTGDSKKYNIDEVPSWVDHVYSASLIIEQVDDWGKYQEGFFNSLIGQKGVVMTTDGYNYLVMNDDVYLYTGITSVSSDESNIGFILSNLRTKETHFYAVAGAEEYSAMASAEGQVQQMNYTASFPLLINLKGRPTYLMSLKDNAGLVKMYAFVDVADYQKVVVTDASLGIEQAALNYVSNVSNNYNNGETTSKNITISSISTAIINGNSYYYIVDTEGNKYKALITINSNLLPFLKQGDTVVVTYNILTDVTELTKIE